MNEFEVRIRDAYADLHLAVPASMVPELALHRRRRLATLGAAAAVSVVAGAGVAIGVDAPPPPVATPPPATSPTGDASPQPTGSRYFRAEDLRFFDPVLPPNLCAIALWEPLPEDLADGMASATDVVLAEVVDVRTSRTLVDDNGNAHGAMLGVVLRATEVLRGDLVAGSDEMVVEFAGGKDSDEAVAAMTSSLPTGLAVWFLRETDNQAPSPGGEPGAVAGHYYQVLHSLAGVLVQGPDHVVAGPLRCPAVPQPRTSTPPESPSMVTEAEGFATLDDIVAYLRTLD